MNAEKRQARIEKRQKKLQALLKKHGNAHRASIALGITPPAFYERLKNAGMEVIRDRRSRAKKASEMRRLLKQAKGSFSTLSRMLQAKELQAQFTGVTVTALRARAVTYGVDVTSRQSKVEGSTIKERKAWLKKMLQECGNANQVAKKLRKTPQAIYERCHRYGLPTAV